MAVRTKFAKLPPIDFQGIADRAELRDIVEADGVALRHGLGFCPFHANDATPALSVYHRKGRWQFKCHGCDVGGDAIDWVALRHGISKVQAAKKLGGDNYEASTTPLAPLPDRPEAVECWKDAAWQAAVDDLIIKAESILWSPAGAPALRWLHSRGLADQTIRLFRLGFLDGDVRSRDVIPILNDDRGPGRVWAPRGITIPWIAPGSWYSDHDEETPEGPRWVGCNVRRLAFGDVSAPLPENMPKYRTVKGSPRGFLYPHPDILPSQGELPMLLVEGEFDALIGHQEVGHMLHVATAGSASVRTLPVATRSALALTTWIFLAMDHDKAGIAAAREWREKYPTRARRVLLPSGKDLSDFIKGGGDVRGWIREIQSPTDS